MGCPSSTVAVFKSLSLLLCILVTEGSSSTPPIGGQFNSALAADPVNVVTNLVLTPEDTFISASWTLENFDWNTPKIVVSYAEEGGGATTCSIDGSWATNTDNCRTTAGALLVLSQCTAYTVTVTPVDGTGATYGVPASDAACTTGCAGDSCVVAATTTTTTAQPITTTTIQRTTTTTSQPKTTTTTQPTTKPTTHPTATTTKPTTTTTAQPTVTTITQPIATTTTIQPMTTTAAQPTSTTSNQPTTPKTSQPTTTTTTTDSTTKSSPISPTTTQPFTTTPTKARTVDIVLLSLIGVVSVLIISFVATFYVNWDAVLKKLGLRGNRKMPT